MPTVGLQPAANLTKEVKGCGLNFVFLSDKTQNNINDIIGRELTSETEKEINECEA